MAENNGLLEQFVRNYFELEVYLQPSNEKLSEEEIEKIIKSRDSDTDRQLMDRLLDDPEAIEMIVESDDSAIAGASSEKTNIISFEEIRKRHPTARPMKHMDQMELKKVAASDDVFKPEEENELSYEDERIKGFVQLVSMTENRFMVSGHFTVKVREQSLLLILPDGQTIDEFEREEGMLLFRAVIFHEMVLSDICYELY